MKVRMSVEQQNRETFMNCVLLKYHFSESDRERLTQVYEQMKICMGPYAAYRINQKVTGIQAIDDGPAAIVSMTLGAGIDRVQEHYMRHGQLEEAYMIDCLSSELLLQMYGEFNAAYAKFHRRYVKRYVFIGNEIPVTVIPDLLQDIRGKKRQPDKQEDKNADQENRVKSDIAMNEETGKSLCDSQPACERLMEHDEISANEYGVMSPSKSVVFYAVLSENPNQACEGICSDCTNEECENRIISGIQAARIVPNMDVYEEIGSKNVKNKENMTYGYQRIFGTQ